MAAATGLEFQLLGPFQVLAGGRMVELGMGQERALLAILLLHANKRVSTDRLTDLLWDEVPPESAPKMIQIYVSRLRRALGSDAGDGRRLLTEAGGYRLHVEPDELDVAHFERVLDEGRRELADGNASIASARLREALSLWRGAPLADLAQARFLAEESARLEELRLGAVEERLDADLALGEGPGVVDELEALVRHQPLRERLAGQLMLALYRSGRQADALAVYKRTRDHLADKLGLEPARPLRELEQAILRQDAALDTTRPATASRPDRAEDQPPLPGTEATRRGLSRRGLAAAAAVLVVAAGTTAAIVLATGGEGRSIRLAPDALGIVRNGRLVDQVHVGAAPGAIAVGGGALWVARSGANSIARLDAGTFEVRETIDVGDGPSGIAFGQGAVWVTNGLDGTVSRIDPGTNRVVQTIQVGNGPAAIAYGLGSIWVANRSDQTVSRLNPRTGNVVDTLAAGTDAAALTVGGGAVWVADQARGRIVRLEPGFTAPVLSINVGNGPSALVFGHRALWVANTLDSTVSRIDPRTNRVVAAVRVGSGPDSLALASDGIWVGNESDETFSRILPGTNSVDRTISLGQHPTRAAALDHTVVVAVGASAASHRGGTLRIVSNQFPFGSIDPVNLGSHAAITLTNDGLTGFRRVGGVEGTQLVPDLALELPSPTAGGKTYTFRLRRGIHYSDGTLVRPEDFRRALQRVFVIYRDPFYYGAVVGASACASTPDRCDLSRGVVPDDRAWTVTFHLERPDPDFLYKLALPTAYAVPATTPFADVGTHPVPATGPYMIAAYQPGSAVRLVRNQRFRPWSSGARPPGYPDEIVWKLGPPPGEQVRRVEIGAADVAFEGVPPSRLAEVQTQYASQVRENLLAVTTFLFLNTRVPPFDDVRVRRAVSFAVDRGAIAHALGGPERAQPTCQILPPNFPGYRPYCPFTLEPSAAGIWTAPDLARARRLVEASGTRGATVTVWIPPNHRPEGAIVVALLKQLGYRARAKQVNDYYDQVGDARFRLQAGIHSWQADYPAPPNFLDVLLSCRALEAGKSTNSSNTSQFCDRAIDSQMRRALALQTTDPASANGLWSTVERALVDRAPLVPLVNLKSVDFLSRRVGNYQFNPQWRVLLDQLWVR